MPKALINVWDKTGITDLATQLSNRGWQLVANKDTARTLSESGLKVTPLFALTGEPEMLAGQITGLHPAIQAGLVARDEYNDRIALASRGWSLIDLVVVNLYPFDDPPVQSSKNLEEAIGTIDIGGIALLRAAAKNYARVCVLTDPGDYPSDINLLSRPDFRLRMARKAFAYTARYDTRVDAYFEDLAAAGDIIQ